MGRRRRRVGILKIVTSQGRKPIGGEEKGVIKKSANNQTQHLVTMIEIETQILKRQQFLLFPHLHHVIYRDT